MAKMDDRMELIGSAILGQANQEARELIDKANAIRKKEISAFEDTVVTEMCGKVQARANNLRLKTVKSISESRLEAHRTLLLHRGEKTAAILDAVRERLIDYAKTASYHEKLLQQAAALKTQYDHADSVIFVAERDMALGDEIKAALGGGTVEADAAIRLGGFQLRNKKAHILVDYTLDERLNDQQAWLLESCGFQIM